MFSEFVLVTQSNHIAILTLNRPEKRNAMDRKLIEMLIDKLHDIAEDDHIRLVIITGKGDHFCAGADIGWMQKIATMSDKENYEDAKLLADLIYQLYHFPKPTIVLAHGITLGGGLGLIAACDITIAAKSAIFGFSEVKLGVIPSIVSPYVISAMGERAARYYFLTGDRFGAEEAYRLGLIHQLCEDDALMSVGISLAKTLLKNSPQALIAVKQLIHQVTQEKITERLVQQTAENLAKLRISQEAQEGLNAFLEKREPKWSE